MSPAAGGGLHVFLAAGEESGDRLGAALMHALKAQTGGLVRFSGVGGRHMAEEGLASLFPLGELAIMGFSAIPAALPKILRRIRQAADAAIAAHPDVVVIIDSPEFTHRVARRIRKRAPKIPIVDYVCPSIWAWRPGRARAMRRYIDHVLALLPFEPTVLRRLDGPPGSYVGHPLSERVDELRPRAEEARRRESNPPLILVMPGSRAGEIHRMQDIFGDALERVHMQIGEMEIVVPTVPHLAALVEDAVAKWSVPARVVADTGQKNVAFRRARVALTKSGTSTLELAIAGVPMVAAYRVSAIEAMIGRLLITAPSAILTNLILGENVIPEFLQEDCTADHLAEALIPLFNDTAERRRQLAAFARLDNVMEIGRLVSASDRAASIVLQLASGLNQTGREAVASGAPRA